MLEKIISKGVLELAIEDVQSLSKDDYALVRKDYFGASDSSILCGVNLYLRRPLVHAYPGECLYCE